jgi:hypothetical protein
MNSFTTSREVYMNQLDSRLTEDAERILLASKNKGLILRLMGAIAFKSHCPKCAYIQSKLERMFTDIDFAGYSAQSKDIVAFFKELGYAEHGMFNVLYSAERLIFHDDKNQTHVDVFLDRLKFNHVINLVGRLEIDYPTLPLANLLLEKLQIVEINMKDVVDVIMLLREHDIGPTDNETINVEYLSNLCSEDWGLWKTVTMNLQKIQTLMNTLEGLSNDDKSDVNSKIITILNTIEKKPKNMKWKMRARIGEKKKWYEEVEEL